MLTLDDIHYHWGPQPVLAGVSIFVGRGQKVGLAGPNGAGKSTLLQIAAGTITPDAGRVQAPRATGYLAQAPDVPGRFDATQDVRQILTSASPTAAQAGGLRDLEARMASTTGRELDDAVAAYGELEERYRADGGYAVEAQAAGILHGLGLGYVELDRPLGQLSAGERTRVEMARVLIGAVDLLLLDEPTNHLDADGTRWLMRFLARTEAGVLLVSHDLRLLDTSISRMYQLDGDSHRVTDFTGTYSEYLAWAEQRDEVQRRTHDRQLADVERLQATANKFRAFAVKSKKMARRAKVLDRRVERLQSEVVDAPTRPTEIGLGFERVARIGRMALRVRELAKGFDERPVLRAATLDLERDQRLAVIGANGAGKSTLLNLIAGHLHPDAGSVELGHNVRLGHFTHQFTSDAARLTAYEHLAPLLAGGEEEVRSVLARLRFGPDHIFRAAATLSAGERARLGIAKLMLEGRTLLLLDEPNSNLDTRSRAWVLQALDEYAAPVIAVSHDAEFVRGLRPDLVLLMPEERLEAYEESHLARVEVV